MSGGRIALSGFDYQTIVILDQLFDHFDAHPGDARARPEGSDDLDLVWSGGGRDRWHHIQVKKPRETDRGILKKQPWRLSEVADELLPNTLRQLRGGDGEQTWILGDEVQPEVRRLFAAGSSAPDTESQLYWPVVHLMARASVVDRLPKDHRNSLLRWRFDNPVGSAADARNHLIATYRHLLDHAGAGTDIASHYQDQVSSIDNSLPGVIARVRILDNYGTETEVGRRFQDRLQREYRLPPAVVADSLFGNLRSFINDVAKQPGKMIDRQSFEVELRSAWPQMSSATEPPLPPAASIVRRDLIEPLASPAAAKVVEVVGISGSGKTTLAAQAAATATDHEPACLPVYVRVQADAAFRDVMSGIAFHLLRRGMPDIFGLAVESKPADDTVINRLAELCNSLPRPLVLLLDLVEGSCNTQFGRDLGQFARALTTGSCRLVIFGQESAFASLSGAEARAVGIEKITMRGFHRDEFANLVERLHPGADRRAVYEIFNRVTVGRAVGISAQLAEALANQNSLAAMRDIVEGPVEDMVSAAERRRFDRLASAVRPAAERLVCFALRFRRQDAEAAFPDENVGGAIDALVSIGLLRLDAENLLEMHEQVRAGLESSISSSVRQAAHSRLAEWYGQKGDVASRIFHLGKAGRTDEADNLARETFLRGEAWRSIEGYVRRRGLVTAQDLIALSAQPERIGDFYLLRYLLPSLATEDMDEALMDLLSNQRSRYFKDYEWARPIVEAILKLRPSRFQDLLEFTVIHAVDSAEREHGLTWLLIAARTARYVPNEELVSFTCSQPADIQRMLLPVLLRDGRRDALGLAFKIFASPAPEDDHRRALPHAPELTIEKREDVLEFLAALPTVPTSMMITRRSLGFDAIGSLVWKARHILSPFCIDILNADSEDVVVRANAWRVLLFVGYPKPQSLLDPMAPKAGLGDYTLLGPAFAPAAYDADRYESILFDPSAAAPLRQSALAVLLFLDKDLETLRTRLLRLTDDPSSAHWEAYFLLLFAKKPFVAGIASLRAMLISPTGEQLPPPFFAACLDAVAEAVWPEVNDLLVESLGHNDRGIRLAAAAGLGRRRSARAFEELHRRLTIETDPLVSSNIARALAASGVEHAVDLSSGQMTEVHVLWQCIVAMRTGDESFAPELVRLASDPSVHWAIRRAAIWASSRIPDVDSLCMLAPVVLAESSPLTIDDDEHLHCHLYLGDLLENGIADLVSSGETEFVELVRSILDVRWNELLWKNNLPDPAEAARWLYKKLMTDPTPSGVEKLRNAIHVPLLHAAVVRAFRIRHMPQEIESVLANTSSVWLAVKCLAERRKVGDNDPDLGPRLRSILAASPFSDIPFLSRVVDDLEGSYGKPAAGAKPPSIVAPAAPVSRVINFTETVSALRGTIDLGIGSDQSLALTPLDRNEIQRLVTLADPSNDPPSGVTKFIPAMTFTSEGHTVSQETWTSSGVTTVPERLRPAIAAANRFELSAPWHEERLRSSWNTTYVAQFLACLGAQADDDRFYQALDADADILLPVLGKFGGAKAVETFLDERLVPALNRCALLGSDEFFEALCNLAQHVVSRKAIPLLSALLGRWASRVDGHLPAQPDDSVELWRGLARLKDHPRFRDIPGWRRKLEKALQANIVWSHKRDIVRILETDAGSYIAVEDQLVREEDWAHFYQSEIDMLDDAAERLFLQLR
ncbi:HEAT repeat domain-containing protein [Rhizobium laguerreae]|uniref:HEAT repeat domain-containing protein n=1 Tax=Rhizobium laguerreae TaxID=1076926 RepID=UPI001C90C449|nr:HEAT repeat domain-containing protein [Rhizobium laguerreae]MBY3574324.1 HEAT repeat domain-containing protein [Rhizobium laguerreae]